MSEPFVLFNFSKECNIQNWSVLNDGVMGGLSKGNFESKLVHSLKKITLRLKGYGKQYQIRVKTWISDYYSYIAYIKTDGEWQTLEVLFSEMIPAFRGNKLDLPNYPGEYMEQFAILIGNKKNEDFGLCLDQIELE